MRILKYVMDDKNVQPLVLPKFSKILSAEGQSGKIVVYAMVPGGKEENLDYDSYDIHIYATGEEINNLINERMRFLISELKFINTVMLYDGRIVVHVFYRFVG